MAYYRTAAGRGKKKALNGQRQDRSVAARVAPRAAEVRAPSSTVGATLARLLPYLCLLVTLLERRRVTPAELLPLLTQYERQHRMERVAAFRYGASRSTNRPP